LLLSNITIIITVMVFNFCCVSFVVFIFNILFYAFFIIVRNVNFFDKIILTILIQIVLKLSNSNLTLNPNNTMIIMMITF
jgi:hypothetical protein